MIRVFYRPLYKLRYLHIALLALLKVPASVTELSEKLRVQQIIIDHALDDILSWSLACSNVGTIELTDRGRRCGVVWLMTDKRGFWEFEDSSGWPLGDGVFSFRKPLRSLEDAGLNSETGEVLSKDIARRTFEDDRHIRLQLDMQIAAGALRHNLLEAFNKSKSLVPIFESSIIQTRTKLHLNQLSRLAAEALCEIERNAVADRTLPTGVRSEFMRIEEEGKKNISEYERKNRDTTDVLLASWLSEQDGLIQQIACLEPNALLVRVDGRGTSPYQCPHPAQP